MKPKVLFNPYFISSSLKLAVWSVTGSGDNAELRLLKDEVLNKGVPGEVDMTVGQLKARL